MTLKIGVVGAGAIGGYFAVQLARAGYDVVVLARGAHLAAMREKGLTITSEEGEITARFAAASDKAEELGPCDAVLFAVKGQDSEQAAADMRPMIGPKTEIISMQNGFFGIDHLVATYGKERVSPGVTYIPAVLDAPGHIRRTGNRTLSYFGPYTPRDMTLHNELAEALRAQGTNIEALAEPMRQIWAKYVVLAPFHAMCSLTRLPVGGWIHHPETRELYLNAMKEVAALGRAKGADVPDSIAERQIEITRTQTSPKTRASMFEDLDRGKRLELEPIIGWIVRESEKLGLSCPIHKMAYALLRPHRDGRPVLPE